MVRPARYPATAFKQIIDSDYGVAAIISILVRAGKSIGPCHLKLQFLIQGMG